MQPLNWRKAHKHNIVTPEEAVDVVRSGDTVAISLEPQPGLLMAALAARRRDLENVRILTHTPHFDPGWLQPGWEDSFPVTIMMYLGEVARPAHDQRRIDFSPFIFSNQFKPYEERWHVGQKVDVFLTVCSPPDRHGFCSFGHSLWDKRRFAHNAKTVLAQADESLIRTYGTNYIHVSRIAGLVDYTPPLMTTEEARNLIGNAPDLEARAELEKVLCLMSPAQKQEILPALVQSGGKEIREYARSWGWVDPPEDARRIAGYLSELLQDGDTIQIGVGTPSGFMPRMGVFDDKKDLGWHSEMGARGILELIERGVINGSRKSINRGVAVFTGLFGLGPEETAYAADNPTVELRDSDYVVDIRNVAAHDSMVSINNAISIDLSGQINSETVFGARLLNGTGGQPEFHIGAVLSRGGRAISLLRSTAVGGAVSRIVSQHEEGAVVTIPRTFADIVVTEYGVARLLGKSIRERARELIAIAHPDFRGDLQKAADRLYYP